VRALIIEHDRLSTPERIGDHLESRGFTLEPFVVVEDIDDPEVTVVFPDQDGYDLIVLMGAPWSTYDPGLQGWVRPEVGFVRHHLHQGTPILGICFGAQIMSTSLGGTVSPSVLPEYGWGTITSDEPAIASGPWFQYHGDEFTLPEGATPLAHNESGLQAFSFGRSLAVQFHPEVTASLLESWCAVGGDRKLIEFGFDPESLIEETSRLAPDSQPALEQLIDWWLDDIH
jgi:GMP synthase-like glutamine amidotransferase